MIGRQLVQALTRPPEPAPETPADGADYVVVITDPNGHRGLSHTTLLTLYDAVKETQEWQRQQVQAVVREVTR